MKLCSWAAGCAQEIPSHAGFCGYHEKVSGGLLGESREADKVVARRILKREGEAVERRLRAVGAPDPIEEETMNISTNRNVYFEPPHYAPDEIDAVLSDGTRLKSCYQLDGRRLGFDRSLPVGTLILLSGVRGWVVGSPRPDERDEQPTA